MSDPKQTKPSAKPADELVKSSKDAAVELSETALEQASGGAVFPSGPAVGSLKIDSSLKLDKASDPGLLLPAVQK